MKYIKTYENFNINEGFIDWVSDTWSNVLDYLKSKYEEFADWVGDRWDEFTNLFDNVVDKIVETIGGSAQKVIENLEKMFRCPISSLDEETAERVIHQKFSSMLKLNEGHMEDESGGDNIMSSLPKESGIVQKVLAVLQNILAINLVSCFVPMAALFAFVLGFGASYGGIFLSVIVSFIAIFVVRAARKLVYKLEFGR